MKTKYPRSWTCGIRQKVFNIITLFIYFLYISHVSLCKNKRLTGWGHSLHHRNNLNKFSGLLDTPTLQIHVPKQCILFLL